MKISWKSRKIPLLGQHWRHDFSALGKFSRQQGLYDYVISTVSTNMIQAPMWFANVSIWSLRLIQSLLSWTLSLVQKILNSAGLLVNIDPTKNHFSMIDFGRLELWRIHWKEFVEEGEKGIHGRLIFSDFSVFSGLAMTRVLSDLLLQSPLN